MEPRTRLGSGVLLGLSGLQQQVLGGILLGVP